MFPLIFSWREQKKRACEQHGVKPEQKD